MRRRDHKYFVWKAHHKVETEYGRFLVDVPLENLSPEAKTALWNEAQEFNDMTPVYREGEWQFVGNLHTN